MNEKKALSLTPLNSVLKDLTFALKDSLAALVDDSFPADLPSACDTHEVRLYGHEGENRR